MPPLLHGRPEALDLHDADPRLGNEGLRPHTPYALTPVIPKARRRSVDGAGTVPVSEKVALKGPWWVMSVPIRSQSGARLSLRVQLCKSVAPGGLGADSHRKFPLDSNASGRKK